MYLISHKKKKNHCYTLTDTGISVSTDVVESVYILSMSVWIFFSCGFAVSHRHIQSKSPVRTFTGSFQSLTSATGFSKKWKWNIPCFISEVNQEHCNGLNKCPFPLLGHEFSIHLWPIMCILVYVPTLLHSFIYWWQNN